MNNDSETSVDMNINILDNQGEKIDIKDNNNEPINDEKPKKPESSDTDYYLNLLANQGKLNDDSDMNSNTSTLSEIIGEDEDDSDDEDDDDDEEKSESSRKSNTSSSKPNYHTVKLTPRNSPKPEQPTFKPPTTEPQKKVLSPQEARMRKIWIC